MKNNSFALRHAFTLLILIPSLALSEEVFEDFSDGSVTDGSPLVWQLDDAQGSGEVVGDVFRLDGSPAVCCPSIYTIIDEYDDVSIEIEVEFTTNRNMFSGVEFRAIDDGIPNGYWAGVQQNGELGIGLSDADITIVKRGVFLPPESLSDGLITYRVDAVGDEISLSAWKTGEGIETATVLNWTDPQSLYTTGDYIAAFLNPYANSANDLDIHSIQFSTVPIPEPCGFHLVCFGLCGVLCMRRSRSALR